jgi:hypothetical protein
MRRGQGKEREENGERKEERGKNEYRKEARGGTGGRLRIHLRIQMRIKSDMEAKFREFTDTSW